MAALPQEKIAPDLDTIANDLATLKHDLATLMADLRDSTVIRARGVAGDATERVTEKASQLYGQAGAGMKALSREIEERPLTALLCAFSVGFVAYRLLTR